MSRLREVPVVAKFERPELMPVGALIHASCDGLRALGLHTHAEAIEKADDGDTERAAMLAAGRALLDVEATLEIAGAHEWAAVAWRVASYLRIVAFERGRRVANG